MNIEVSHISKYFSEFKLEDISLKVPKGKIVGLVGENGAGKTTLIKCILRIMNVDKGSVRLFDSDYSDDIKEDIGVVFDHSFLNEKYNVKDINLIMKYVHKNWDEALFFKYMNDYQIPLNQEYKKLSTGMKKKVEIAVALSYHPKLLILDEPTSGMDPIIRSEILDMFQNFVANGENSILLSTHITSDLEHIADMILFISKGKIVFEETMQDIFDKYRVLVMDKDDFEKFDKGVVMFYKENKNDYQVLIDNKDMKDRYKEYVHGITTLDDIMLLYLRGVKC